MRKLISAILGVFLIILIITASAGTFSITSTGLLDKGKIPNKYSCDGQNIPPGLSWSNPPEKTQSFALILYSPDAVIRNPFYNWVLYNIPRDAKGIAEGADLPEGTLIGNNSLGEAKYSGPCPPDERIHHYIFSLYALDITVPLSGGAEIDELLAEIKNHILEKTELMGTFSH